MSARRVSLAIFAGLLCVLAIVCTEAWIKGYRMYVIHTGSMQPTLKLGTLVIDKPASLGYRPGDVITFKHSDLASDVVTHRITDITSTGLIHTKGDANATADVWDIRPNQVEGVRMLTVPRLGYFVVFLQRPSGVASLVLAIMATSLLWSLFFPSAETAEPRRAAHRATGKSAAAMTRSRISGELPARSTRVTNLQMAERPVDDAPTTILDRSDVAELHALLKDNERVAFAG